MTTKISTPAALKYSFVILLLLAAGCGDLSTKTPNAPDEPHFSQVNTADTYVHAPTGMEFPTQVEGFKRARILQYEPDGSNISVGYTLDKYGFKIADATVYIYPVEIDSVTGPISLEKHFDEVRALLFNIYADARDLEDGKITIGQPFGPQNGLMFRFVHKPPELFKSKLCYANLYLFEHGPWFIKYRLTNLVNDDVDVRIKFGTFMQTLAWPQLPHADGDYPIIITPDTNF